MIAAISTLWSRGKTFLGDVFGGAVADENPTHEIAQVMETMVPGDIAMLNLYREAIERVEGRRTHDRSTRDHKQIKYIAELRALARKRTDIDFSETKFFELKERLPADFITQLEADARQAVSGKKEKALVAEADLAL